MFVTEPFMSWIISYLAFDECGSDMKRMVDWDDKETGESEIEPFEEVGETDVSDDEQRNDEEPRIKVVLENLSKPVSRERASDLLHHMAASKDILLWTPRGQLLRKNRIIRVAFIIELWLWWWWWSRWWWWRWRWRWRWFKTIELWMWWGFKTIELWMWWWWWW